MKFAEGDKVRNVKHEMGPGVITRHHPDRPGSIRWAGKEGTAWWVSFPEFRDPKWVEGMTGHEGWFYEDFLGRE